MSPSEVAKRFETQMDAAKWPEHLSAQINFPAWARAIINGERYEEPVQGYITRLLALQSIMAKTPEQVFLANNVTGLQEIIPDVAGATSGPHEILDMYVAESSIDTGYSCYVIVEWLDLNLGTVEKWTTSATNIMATLLGLLKFGQWPIRCQVKRGDSKDRSGTHLLIMLPPD